MKLHLYFTLFLILCHVYSNKTVREQLDWFKKKIGDSPDAIINYARLLSEEDNPGFEEWDIEYDKFKSFDQWNGRVMAPWYEKEPTYADFLKPNFDGNVSKPKKYQDHELDRTGRIRNGDGYGKAKDAFGNVRPNQHSSKNKRALLLA